MIMHVWILSMISLLMLSLSIPDAFYGAIVIFYVPFAILALYVLSLLPQEIWVGAGLMCLFIYNM